MELFCELDLSSYRQEIRECFMSAAFEAVDHLVEVSCYIRFIAKPIIMNTIYSVKAKGKAFYSFLSVAAEKLMKVISIQLAFCWPGK